jgi:hypothetical protein
MGEVIGVANSRTADLSKNFAVDEVYHFTVWYPVTGVLGVAADRYLDVTASGEEANVLVRELESRRSAPIVGAGLPGLVAACGGLVALARRRRHVA